MNGILMAGLVTSTLVGGRAAQAGGWSEGVLSITNARHEPVRVLIDQRSMGEILPSEAEVYRLPAGTHDVQLLDLRGASLKREAVLIQAFKAEAVLLDPASGELDITNQTGAALRLLVDGQPAGSLAPGARVELTVEPGRHKVSAVFEQSGQTRSLAEQSLRVDPGAEARIALQAPTTGLVRVVNEQSIPAMVQINGNWAGSLAARQTLVFEAPVGEAWVVVTADGGRSLERERLIVSPYADNTVTVEQEAVGTLTVYNPLPIPVTLKSGPHTRTLQPQERASWERVRAGQRTIEVYRLSGEKIGELSATISTGRATTVAVVAPREGVIAFTNTSRHEAWVYVDDRLVEQVPPGAQVRLLSLPGRHEVRVLVAGRVLYAQHPTVDLFQDTVIALGADPGSGGGNHPRSGGGQHGYHRY